MEFKEQLTQYENFHHYNHVNNLGIGPHFNPCSLLLFIPKTDNIYLYNLYFSHESSHSRISSCVYGKIIFLLRDISLKLTSAISRDLSKKYFETIWKACNKINSIINYLIRNWVVVQEGYATYQEYESLKMYPKNEVQEFEVKLKEMLQKPSAYKKGYDMLNSLSEVYSKPILRNLIHEIGNIDYLPIVRSMFKTENYDHIRNDLPDNLLINHSNALIEFKKIRSIIWRSDKDAKLNSTESINTVAIARHILENELKVKLYNNEKRNLFEDILNMIDSSLGINVVSEIILKMKAQYFKEENLVYSKGGANQVLGYPCNKIKKEYFTHLEINNPNVSENEKECINYLNNLYELMTSYLPNNLDSYLNLLKILESQNLNLSLAKFYINIFPPTNFKKYDIEVYRNQKNTVINQHLNIDKMKIEIKCDQEQSNLLTTKLKMSDPLIEVDQLIENPTFGHWSQNADVILSIIASSIGIISVISDWISKLKDNEKQSVIVIIDKKEYSNIEEIEEALDLAKSHFEKK